MKIKCTSNSLGQGINETRTKLDELILDVVVLSRGYYCGMIRTGKKMVTEGIETAH